MKIENKYIIKMENILLDKVKEEGIVKNILNFKKEFEYAELKEMRKNKLHELKKLENILHNSKQLILECAHEEDKCNNPMIQQNYESFILKKINTKILEIRQDLAQIKIEEYYKYKI
jgi:signal recognition particle subunit SEC65